MAGVDLSKEKAAQIFGVDTRTIDRWIRDGCPSRKVANRRWSLNSAQVSDWLQQRERESILGDMAKLDENEARRRKTAAEASREELKLAREQGEVVSIAEYEAELAAVCGTIRAKALNYPAKMAPLVMQSSSTAEAREILAAGMNELLNELSGLDGSVPGHPDGAAESDCSEAPGLAGAGATSGPHGKPVGRSRAKAESGIES